MAFLQAIICSGPSGIYFLKENLKLHQFKNSFSLTCRFYFGFVKYNIPNPPLVAKLFSSVIFLYTSCFSESTQENVMTVMLWQKEGGKYVLSLNRLAEHASNDAG